MKLEDAQVIAQIIYDRLKPYCDRIDIAGSVSRKIFVVKDIEIVCQPKMVEVQEGFFESVKKRDPDFIGTVLGIGVKVKGHPVEGRYVNILLLKENIALDLFIPQETDYYRQLATRTGPRDYSHNVIANAWVKGGWVGTADGLRLRSECEGGVKATTPGYQIKEVNIKPYKCIAENPTLPPAWGSEQEFFDWLGVKYLPPHKRL